MLASGAEDVVLLHSRHAGDDECFEEPNIASPEAVGRPDELIEVYGLRVTQDVRERLMGEVRSRMTNFMSGKGNEQHPDDGSFVFFEIVMMQFIRPQETEKARIDSDVAETAFEKKETIDGQETLNLEQSVEGSREDLLMREEESNKERLQEKEKSSEKSAVDVGEKHQLSVDTKEDDSDIDVETVQEIVPQKVTVEKNRETSSDYLRASEKVTSQEVSIQQGIAEETRSTHFRSSRTCVQSDKKARIQRFDSATLAKASTSSTSFTSSGSDADEVAKPRPEGQFGVPPSYRGFSLVALRDSDDKPTSSGSVSYTPHKRIPTS
uniref:Uncharacterized protein n=1 Tax=Parascaris equorum TaxID=6256 RepID=A0A914RK26_PAREQ